MCYALSRPVLNVRKERSVKILQCVNDQRDAQILIISFYSTVFCLLYMFRTNLVVHHKEHGIIYCITQFGATGTIVLSGESRLA